MRTIIAICMLALHAPLLYSEEIPLQEEKTISPLRFPEQIRILLEKEIDEILLEVKGPYYIFNPEDDSRITSGLLGKRFIVRSTTSGIKWGEEFPGIYQIRVVPRSKESSLLVGGIQYEGAITIYAVGNKIHIVNEVPIETYIKCLLSPQFTYPLENEVMSAIAILARTDAYYEALRGKDAYWHLDAKEIGYIGSALNLPKSPIEKVVDQTKNILLVYSSSKASLPFPAKWTDHSAGKTACFSAIFRKESDYSSFSVEAPHAALDREDAKWQFSLSKSTLCQKFQIQDLKNVEHFIDKKTHKIYAVRLHHTNGYKDISFFEFQRGLGPERLQSNEFTSELKGESVSFKGFGKGHGVGLCLYSASAMAQNGENAVKILAKFFPETFLYNLSALPPVERPVYHQ